MNTHRRAALAALAAGAAAATLLVAPTADAARPDAEVKHVTAKTICRDDGNTRVRVRVELTKGDKFLVYTWKVPGRYKREVDALVTGPTTETLFAFTVPAGKTAHATVGNGPYSDADTAYLSKDFTALDC